MKLERWPKGHKLSTRTMITKLCVDLRFKLWWCPTAGLSTAVSWGHWCWVRTLVTWGPGRTPGRRAGPGAPSPWTPGSPAAATSTVIPASEPGEIIQYTHYTADYHNTAAGCWTCPGRGTRTVTASTPSATSAQPGTSGGRCMRGYTGAPAHRTRGGDTRTNIIREPFTGSLIGNRNSMLYVQRSLNGQYM